MSQLFPTQEADDSLQLSFECTDQRHVWGRLLPLRPSLTTVELVDTAYTFGRGEDCQIIFSSSMFKDAYHFAIFSKYHCKIYSEISTQGRLFFIQDLSSNGTFVNGTKIGRGKIQPLNNNDEISLATKSFKCYIFSDVNSVEGDFPTEVTRKYTVCRSIGRGACGEVRLVFDKQQCQKYAMKIVQKKQFSIPVDKDRRNQSEVEILLKLDHPCVISTYDVLDTEDAVYMILELVEGGELFDRIVQIGRIPEADAKFIFLQIALAVEYLHENGVTHRDLKPENILLANTETRCLTKVTDFGLSKLADGNTMLRTFCGTPTYLAPEVLRTAGSGTYTSSIDIWSLGVILYVCLVGYPPFTEERTDFDLETQIVEGRYDFPQIYWEGISEEAIDLVKKMLEVNPSERLSIAGVLSHTWLSDSTIKQQVDELIARSYPESRVHSSVPSLNSNYEDHSSDSGVEATLIKDTSNNICATPQQDKLLQDKPLVRKRPGNGDCTVSPKRSFL